MSLSTALVLFASFVAEEISHRLPEALVFPHALDVKLHW